jgi:hypothetical protein
MTGFEHEQGEDHFIGNGVPAGFAAGEGADVDAEQAGDVRRRPDLAAQGGIEFMAGNHKDNMCQLNGKSKG